MLVLLFFFCGVDTFAQSGGANPQPVEKNKYEYGGEEMNFDSVSEDEDIEEPSNTNRSDKQQSKDDGVSIYEDGAIKQMDFSSGGSGGVLKQTPSIKKEETKIVEKKTTPVEEIDTDKQVQENYTGPTTTNPNEIGFGIKESDDVEKMKVNSSSPVGKVVVKDNAVRPIADPIPTNAVYKGHIETGTPATVAKTTPKIITGNIGPSSMPPRVVTGSVNSSTISTSPSRVVTGNISPSTTTSETIKASPKVITGNIGPSDMTGVNKTTTSTPPKVVTGNIGPSTTTSEIVPASPKVITGNIGPADMTGVNKTTTTTTQKVVTGNIGPADMENDNLYQTFEQEDIIKKHKILQGPLETKVYPFSPEEVPTYTSEEYRQRVMTLPTIIPMVYNDKVEHFIKMFVEERRGQVETMLSKTEMYFPVFEEALDRHGLPMELKYLPIIESALMPHARSESGAVGLWQLPYGTGRMYGLEANSYIDERRDPLLSTEVAVKHLDNLFQTYKDWYLVIAAYNCGEGTVNKAIKRAGGETDYWKIVQYLPEEAHAYVPLFIAAVYVMNHFPEHNLRKDASPYSLYVTDTVMVKKLLDLKDVAEFVSINLDELLFLNPAVVRNVIPASKNGYPLVLPLGKIQTFQIYLNNQRAKESDIVFEDPGIPKLKTDSPWNLVSPTKRKKIGSDITEEDTDNSSPEDIESKKGIGNSNKEKMDNILDRPEVQKVVIENDGIKQTISIDHKVEAGQGLSDVANLYNCEIEDLMKWNKLRSKRIRSGTVLSIIVPAEQEMVYRNITMRQLNEGDYVSYNEPTIATIRHTVTLNETYQSLIDKYKVSKKDIMSLNKLKGSDAELIQGMIILIPKK